MNTKNSKTTESNRFKLYFTGKLDLRGQKTISLMSLSIITLGKISKKDIKATDLN